MVKGIRLADKQEQKVSVRSECLVSGRIVVLSDSDGQDHELVSMLESAGYRVEALTQFEAFKSICDRGTAPAAVILDRKFKKGESPPARILADMQAQCQNSVPIICLSAQQDVVARLAAYRAGVTRYLSKPVERARLLRIIAESALQPPEQPYRVMLIDDESEQQTQHAQMLRMAGMEVSVVNDPLQVTERLDKFAADVLVLGMEMELCTGPELGGILRDDPQYAAIPIVYLSTESELLLQIQAINSSSENFLSKLVSPSHMIGVISKHARGYRRGLEKAEILRSARYELERQQQALDAHAIVSVADLSGNIIYVNEKFCEVSGYSSAELIGKNHRIIKSGQHPDEFYTEMWHTIAGGNIWHGEVCNRSKNGNLYWVDTSIVPFIDAEGLPYHYISIRTDITHVKANEIAMVKAKEAAEAASRAKSEFLASMSHELRTPLNAILGFSQLFSMDEQLPQSTRDNSRQIEGAGRHLLSLVNDMIDLARIESNQLDLSLEEVKVKGVVCDSLNMVQSMAHDRGVKIIIMQCEVMEITVWADFNRLRQALINLLTNAIKYNKANGTVHLVCEIIEDSARIAVTDSGVGIPADKRERIFHAFDRLGEERGEVEGTGIGLVITKRIVEAMGGTIAFESTEGQGSTFWMELPLATFHERSGLPAASSSATGASFHSEHAHADRPVVLYIEDNPMNLRLMQQVFSSRQDWELRTATTAESGLEMVRANPPELILMDINLPGMDGYQALSQIRAEPGAAHIPVIALTANAMKGDRDRGLDAGFADYLTKPLDILKLLGVLDNILN
ncbi:MAG TPA: response regulator [Gallionellaceae bacterium]|nr:response regulator [Gallionellaceae bacterium]